MASIKLTPPFHFYPISIDKGGTIVWIDVPIYTWGEYDKYKTQGFGESLLDYTKYGIIAHNGEDHSAPLGTSIFPMHDGLVTWVSTDDYSLGHGVQVTSQDEKYRTRYWHMKKGSIAVQIWDKVTINTKIGEVNSTGNSTGNHLHSDLKELENGRVKNNDNGYFGAVDFSQWKVDRGEEDMKLVQKKGENKVYLVTGGVRLWVLDPHTRDTLNTDVVEGDPYEDTIYGGAIGVFNPDEQ